MTACPAFALAPAADLAPVPAPGPALAPVPAPAFCYPLPPIKAAPAPLWPVAPRRAFAELAAVMGGN